MKNTQTVNRKAMVLGIFCLSLCASANISAKTTDVTMPAYLIKRTYTTNEALALKKYDLNFRRHYVLETATREALMDSAQNSYGAGRDEREVKMAWANKNYEEFFKTYDLQLKNECWNIYIFNKYKGAHSDICYLLRSPALAGFNRQPGEFGTYSRNRFLQGEPLTASEQRNLASKVNGDKQVFNLQVAKGWIGGDESEKEREQADRIYRTPPSKNDIVRGGWEYPAPTPYENRGRVGGASGSIKEGIQKNLENVIFKALGL